MNWLQPLIRLPGILTPDRNKRSARFYDALSTHFKFGDSSLYLNLGYWDDVATGYDQACERLAEVLGEVAQLRPGCAVLDCGCGFGDAAMFWIRRFAVASIECLTISPVQVETARERMRAAGLEERVRVHLGSATRIPFADASFDHVTALETAFEYDTREEFFREAFRVLKNGGRLATADVVPLEGGPPIKWWQRPARTFMVPPGTVSGYVQRLENAGFTAVRVESIAKNVFAPFGRFARKRLHQPEIRARMHPIARWAAAGYVNWVVNNPMDYIIATADKP